MIGLHLTIDIWRHNRDDDGWQYVLGDEEGDEAVELVPGNGSLTLADSKQEEDPLFEVRASPRFRQDILAMKILLAGKEPSI